MRRICSDAFQKDVFYLLERSEPKGFVPPKNKALALHLLGRKINPELRAALVIQGVYRKKQARKVLRQKKGAKAAEDSHESGWTAVLDDGSGEYYYYNTETEECVWDKPEELMTEEEKADRAAEEDQPEWIRVYDPASVDYYYWNQKTGENVWEEPECVYSSLIAVACCYCHTLIENFMVLQRLCRAKRQDTPSPPDET